MEINIENARIGVVGLGLMGSSIATNFLLAGHHVVGIEPIGEAFQGAAQRIKHHLTSCDELDLLSGNKQFDPTKILISQSYQDLQACDLVLESVLEDLKVKTEIIQKIEAHVSDQCIIASNTSAIPISTLQAKMQLPNRFLGLHWSEPAYATRYLEIICGAQTDLEIAIKIQNAGSLWGKEPILLKRDIRGFVTNRLMYAVYREGLQMMAKGEADLESLDKAFKYDTGSWISIMGIFQRMDYLGIQHFANLTKRTFPQLSNEQEVPPIMQKLVQETGRGVHDQNGLHSYTESEAAHWKEAFERFSSEIYQLSKKWLH